MSEKIKWAIVGPGNIAKKFAAGLADSKTGVLEAVAGRDAGRARAFADERGAPSAYGSLDELFADEAVQAVYIATPHPAHTAAAMQAAEAGKHILCEKPVGLNYYEAMAQADTAALHGVFYMEAFMYRCHPQTIKLVELLREKAVGEVRMIQASFGFAAKVNPESRLFSRDLGGGGILDVGCYPVSMARLVAGIALGTGIAEPVNVQAVGCLGETGVDEQAAAVLQFPGNIIAEVSTAVRIRLENAVRIFATEGSITIPQPWIPCGAGDSSVIKLRKGGKEELIEVQSPVSLYAYEVDAVGESILGGKTSAAFPAMTPADTLGNMKTLDMWRRAIGLEYDVEKPGGRIVPLSGKNLSKTTGTRMEYGKIEGLDRDVSRLVLGAATIDNSDHAAVLFDAFYERGGNCFDTGYIYGGGKSERLLGQWIRDRGIRDEMVILDKGAHTPHCNPEALTSQLMESLERMETDYTDIYMMHRDNPDIPVGEFIDVLNQHRDAGRIKTFGVSNWSLERVAEANEYAKKNNMAGISGISNNLSLAEMIDAPWGGCIAAVDRDSLAWHEENQMPLFPWSSQAQGFFAYVKSEFTERCWMSPENLARRQRAEELGKKYRMTAINMALAWVLAQPFPVFPLVGPRTICELNSCVDVLNVKLTPEEVQWLRDGDS